MALARARFDELLAQSKRRSGAPRSDERGERWGFHQLAGRMVELTQDGATGASLTLATGLVAQAHAAGESAAWVGTGGGVFFPPDVAVSGVDLDALVVVRVADARAGGRVADTLLRSGGFGLVVLDLGEGAAAARALTPALLGRLQALAERSRATLVCLTDKKADAPSLGAGISLRASSRRRRDGAAWVCEVAVLKDRRSGPGWQHREVVRGTPGLR